MTHDRVSVLQALEAQGVCPVFYHPDPEVCLNVIRASARGGAKVVEFTNRGDFACDLFGEINRTGMTVILVTHEADVAAKARRTIRLRDGKVEPELVARAS